MNIMANHFKAPRLWPLTKNETINTFQTKENLEYQLSADPMFSPYMTNSFTWLKKSASNPNRGFTDDPAPQEGDVRRFTADQKVT